MQTLTNILQKKFVGADDLRKKLTEILNTLPDEKEIIITHHGIPKAVLMDLNFYTQLQNHITKSSSKK